MHGLRSCDVEAHNPESQEKRDDDEMAKEYGKGDTKHEEVEERVEKETEGDGNTNVAITKDSYEKKKHAELLEIPPHEAQVFLTGFPHNFSEKELRDFCCKYVGDVFAVR